MTSQEKLYEAFGEMIYVVAKADGLIQAEELQELKKLIKGHPFEESIEWSFIYEDEKSNDLDYLYRKALDTFVQHGPDPSYTYFLDVLKRIAAASDGIDEKERAMIESFQSDLRKKLLEDLEKNNLYEST